jgi:hypothetical protein
MRAWAPSAMTIQLRVGFMVDILCLSAVLREFSSLITDGALMQITQGAGPQRRRRGKEAAAMSGARSWPAP